MSLLTPVAVFLGGLSFLPKLNKYIVALDKWLQKVTRGKLSVVNIAGLQSLMLTVPGRKSGILRSTPLLCVPRGDDFLIAGSNWGAPEPPVWVGNLEAAGEATITFKGTEHRVRATYLQGEDRAAAWTHMLATWPNYAKYEKRTTREIKVFELSRFSG